MGPTRRRRETHQGSHRIARMRRPRRRPGRSHAGARAPDQDVLRTATCTTREARCRSDSAHSSPIIHSLIVTFRYCQSIAMDQKPAHGIGTYIRRKRRSPRSLSGRGSVILVVSRGEMGLFPTRGKDNSPTGLAPLWLPTGGKGAGIRTLTCVPSRTRTYGLLLRRHSRSTAWRCQMWPDMPLGRTGSG
jgi:hypothetical protein